MEGGFFMLIVFGALFFLGIMSISYQLEVLASLIIIGLVMLVVFHKEKRFLASLLLSFLIGFVLFMVSNHFVGTLTLSKEVKIIWNRVFLGFMIIALVVTLRIFKKKVTWYNNKPDWKNPIVLPFHRVDTFWFWLMGIFVNAIVYLVFIVQKDTASIQSLVWFCLCFSLINAVFEEVIWRGIMLSALKTFVSTRFAIIVTSVGFGLLHLAIGFSLPLSLLISSAGVIYAVITLKTNSIYPSIVFHFVINIGMVYSGFIV